MVGVGVIGAGYWGKNHVRVFRELLSEGLVDSVVICDKDEERIKDLGENFGLEYTSDYKAFLDSESIDAVSVVTPSPTHYKIASEFLKSGKDVFIEKPLTLDSAQARALVETAEKNKKTLMVGHIFRYHTGIRELKHRLDAGEFGKVHFFLSNRLDFGAPRRDMGVVFALGIHEVDMFCYLLGVKYPQEITAITANYLQPNVEEMATIALGFKNGVKGFATESWLVPVYGKRRELVVIGSEKSARIDYLKPQELEIFDTRIKKQTKNNDVLFTVENTQTTIIPIQYQEPLMEELRHFIECVKTRSRPLSDGAVGLRAVEMAEAALKSSTIKKTIKL